MTDKRKRVLVSWSGGKDSSLALHELRRSRGCEIAGLLTTVSKEYDRISHHGVRTELLEQQAAAVGLPLHKVYLDACCSNEAYEAVMKEAMLGYREAGVQAVVFGDIFLEDLRRYRERKLSLVGMETLFPIWRRDTTELVRAFIDLGFKAYLSCVDGAKLDQSFAGRSIDLELLNDLPDGVDPCGENGEFHTFVYDGPMFQTPVEVHVAGKKEYIAPPELGGARYCFAALES